MDRLRKRIDDAGMIRLIRAYLNAGIMRGGVLAGGAAFVIGLSAAQFFPDPDKLFFSLGQRDHETELSASGVQTPIRLAIPEITYVARPLPAAWKHMTAGALVVLRSAAIIAFGTLIDISQTLH